MENKLEFYATNRQKLHKWLEKNHNKRSEVWLIYYKKDTDKPSITYPESVEEAICFGWIDGLKKRIDDERYTHRFTPRKSRSKWSEINQKLAKKMIQENRMTPAGLLAYSQRQEYKKSTFQKNTSKEITLSEDVKSRLMSNIRAWENFQNLAPSHRRQYAGWIMSAKKPETRIKRVEESIALLEENSKLGMK